MAGAEKSSKPQKEQTLRQTIREMGFTCLPFDEGAVAPFSSVAIEGEAEGCRRNPFSLCGLCRH